MKTIRTILCILSLAVIFGCSQKYSVYSLKVNSMTAPTGIDESPVFEWKLSSSENGVEQASYQIKVYDESKTLVWDSGVVSDKHPFAVEYSGPELKSNSFYRWTLVSTDNKGNKAKGESTFSTGLLSDSEWSAKWIEFTGNRKPYHVPSQLEALIEVLGKEGLAALGVDVSMLNIEPAKDFVPEDALDAPIFFRKSFNVSKKIKRATAYATAHGLYSLSFNGHKVSEELAPGNTTYPHFLEYQQYDVTPYLSKGENVLGAIVADGWYTGKISVQAIGEQYGKNNALLCQLMIEYTDGSVETIGSDSSFKWNNNGPYLYADITEGEHYDANKELVGWDKPGYDDSSWQASREMDYGYGNLAGRKAPAVAVVRTIPCKQVLHAPNGEIILDFGENIVGRVRATITGTKGQTVTFNHQEMLDKDGNLSYGMHGKFKNQTTKYTFAEDGTVTYAPEFSFQGFQYVRVTGIDNPEAKNFVAEVMNTDMDLTGTFSCSDELLTKLQSNIVRSQSGNMLSIPTDCPHREKAGWTGDMQIYSPTATYNMDVQAFLSKWLVNMRFDQYENGGIPDVTPIMPVFDARSGGNSCAAWGDACVIVPWRLYQAYGDKKILEDNFEMMEKWNNFVTSETTDYLWNKDRFQYGEWALPSVPPEYSHIVKPGRSHYNVGQDEIATAMYYYTTDLLEKISSTLGKTDRESYYHDLKENIRNAYINAYVSEDGHMEYQMQGQYVLPLYLGLVPEDRKPQMQAILYDLVHNKYSDKLNTGFVTTPFLMDVLTDIDKTLAMDVLFQTDCPSWLYEVKMGATTMWESWNAKRPDGSLEVSSFNHFAYGSVGDYIYRRILGLCNDGIAYEKILIDPVYPDQLSWAEGSHETPFGKASVRWEKDGTTIKMDITVPPGATATVVTKDGNKTFESGHHTLSFER